MKLNQRLFVTVTLLLVCLASCKSKNDANKTFLDFYLGMPHDEYLIIKDSLIKAHKLQYKSDGHYSYEFTLSEGKKAEAKFSPSFDNGFLTSIDLYFGSFNSTNYVDNSESTSSVQSVLALYCEKYGSPIKAKEKVQEGFIAGWFNGEFKDFDVYKWDRGNFKVSFFPGTSVDWSSQSGGINSYGAKIEYDLKDEKKDDLNKKKAQDNLKDL